ncbi:MAG: M20/M25/M40 family metallo-hydrolase [Pirellulales bacterium]
MRSGSLHSPLSFLAAMRDIGLLLVSVASSGLIYQSSLASDGPTNTVSTTNENRTLFGLTEDRTDAVLRIIDEGKNRNQTLKHLTHLCEEIGPRLTGSSRLEKANNWVADKFREFGMQNVELRKWGEVPVRFDRGPSTGKMVSPVERTFEFTSRAWSAGTNGPVKGPVLREPKTEEELEAIKDKLKGAWILRKPGSPMPGQGGGPGGPGQGGPGAGGPGAGGPGAGGPGAGGPGGPGGNAPAFDSRLESAGINGYISSARAETVTTGGVRGIMQLEIEKISPIVSTTVRRSDYDAINSRISDGEEVVVEFDMKHTFTAGPIPVYNTIGEIPGTEKPDEIVIISAHLDSWDGPGSQGTVDNGTGSSVTIEAARILTAAGVKPKRTIRFILWSGEEQGLLGSRAYVESLSEDERAKISAVFVDDSGTNQQSSLTCAETMESMLRQAVDPMNYAFPDVPIRLNVQPRMPARGGASDHSSFNAVGIPGFFWGKSGTAVYGYAWHTQNDRLDQAVPAYLTKNSTVSAIAAFMLSEAETLLPRSPAAPAGEEPERPRRRRADGEGGQGRAEGQRPEGARPEGQRTEGAQPAGEGPRPLGRGVEGQRPTGPG